jgi:hypothetical protein
MPARIAFICFAENCNAPHKSKGYCSKHYARLLRKGKLSLDRESHKASFSKGYRRYKGMFQRCHNVSSPQYKDYGGRGINICQGWTDSYKNYELDVGEPPFVDASIDRINNDKGYWCGHCLECIENCWPKNWRWATRMEQNQNRRERVNKTGYTGVSYQNNRYYSYIYLLGQGSSNRKKIHLGIFDNPESAYKKHLEAKELRDALYYTN